MNHEEFKEFEKFCEEQDEKERKEKEAIEKQSTMLIDSIDSIEMSNGSRITIVKTKDGIFGVDIAKGEDKSVETECVVLSKEVINRLKKLCKPGQHYEEVINEALHLLEVKKLDKTIKEWVSNNHYG